MNGIHAATGERLMGILHQPEAVVAVHNHVGGNDGPLARIRGGGKLAIPDLRLRDDRSGIVEAPLIQVDFLQRVLIGKAFYLGEGLIPVEIGIVYQGIGGTSKAERIYVREVVRVSMHRGEKTTQR